MMGKKRQTSAALAPAGISQHSGKFALTNSKVDQSLASLFALSAGPVQISRQQESTDIRSISKPVTPVAAVESDEPETSEAGVDATSSEPTSDSESEPEEEIPDERPSKRRKVKGLDDLEGKYLDRLAREEAKELAHNVDKRAKAVSEDAEAMELDEVEEEHDLPVHEAVTGQTLINARDLSKRTVFLGNVSVEAIKSKSAKRALLDHLSSCLGRLPSHDPPHRIESLRFRSTAFADAGLPKKAAFAKKELMETTTKSTNAYVVYSCEAAARTASRLLNGTIVLERHLRADHLAHPSKIDHKRCIFVGNLGFVDEETIETTGENEEGTRKKRNKSPGDTEEGLWRTFGKVGTVESVRVVRDKATRVGKGFAYVQFQNENAVEAALLYNDQKFPPLLPRKLRVVRAKKVKKSELRNNTFERGFGGKKAAGALRDRKGGSKMRTSERGPLAGLKRPESLVFEGHRASKVAAGRTKARANKRSGKRPDNRSSRRGAAFKTAGSKE